MLRALAFALILATPGCAAPPKAEPMGFDIGNLTLRCFFEGKVLRWLLIEDGALTRAVCDDPPGGVKPEANS